MKNMLHYTTTDGRDTFINVDSIRYIQAHETGTLICVGPEEYFVIDATIEEVMNAITEVMKDPEDADD